MKKQQPQKFNWIKFGVIAAAIFLIAGFVERIAMPTNMVAVSGECITRVERDRTSATVRVTVLDRNSANSVRRAQTLYQSALAFVQSIDDETLELTTGRFDSFERNRWDQNRQTEVSMGFETTIELIVMSENRATIEEVLGFFADRENVFMGNLTMTSSPLAMNAAIADCIQYAVDDARSRADAVARAGNRRIGRMITAEFAQGAGGNMMPRPMMAGRMVMAQSMDMGGMSLVAADGEISVRVNAVFNLR